LSRTASGSALFAGRSTVTIITAIAVLACIAIPPIGVFAIFVVGPPIPTINSGIFRCTFIKRI